ncbi:MAG TPA: hypothetical protein VGD57_02265 [Candidatus Dormibacteraeota bacterium]
MLNEINKDEVIDDVVRFLRRALGFGSNSPRITVVEVGPSQGLLREAVDSLCSLFDNSRGMLRQHGPSVARVKGQGSYSSAVIILNQVLGARRVASQTHRASGPALTRLPYLRSTYALT